MAKVVFLRAAQLGSVVYVAGQVADVSEAVAKMLTASGAARAHELPKPTEVKAPEAKAPEGRKGRK